MSEIRILNLCHKKSILDDIYRQSLLTFFYILQIYVLILLIFLTYLKLTEDRSKRCFLSVIFTVKKIMVLKREKWLTINWDI